MESKETLKQQLKQQQIDAMFALCKNEETIECTKKVLKIYEYLKNNIKDNELLETDEDYKELAMLIISLDDYNDYSEYYAMFNITQEYVLSLIGLTK